MSQCIPVKQYLKRLNKNKKTAETVDFEYSSHRKL
jgi:hypothetical protein